MTGITSSRQRKRKKGKATVKTYDELKARVDRIKCGYSATIANRYHEYVAQADPDEYARHPEWHSNITMQVDRRYPQHSEKAIAAAAARLETARENGIADINRAVDEWVFTMRRELAYKPDELTDDARLLTSPLTLTSTDLRAIIDRNPENDTMRRMVTQYAEERRIHLPEGYAAPNPDTLAGMAELLRQEAVNDLRRCTEPIQAPEAEPQTLRAAFGLKGR